MKKGDCFIVVSTDGRCWDGKEWILGWGRALQFRSPQTAYEDCQEAAGEAKRLTGKPAMITYIQEEQTSVRKSVSLKSSTSGKSAAA